MKRRYMNFVKDSELHDSIQNLGIQKQLGGKRLPIVSYELHSLIRTRTGAPLLIRYSAHDVLSWITKPSEVRRGGRWGVPFPKQTIQHSWPLNFCNWRALSSRLSTQTGTPPPGNCPPASTRIASTGSLFSSSSSSTIAGTVILRRPDTSPFLDICEPSNAPRLHSLNRTSSPILRVCFLLPNKLFELKHPKIFLREYLGLALRSATSLRHSVLLVNWLMLGHSCRTPHTRGPFGIENCIFAR